VGRSPENVLNLEELARFKAGCVSGQFTQAVGQDLQVAFRTRLAKAGDPNTLGLAVAVQNTGRQRLAVRKLRAVFLGDQSRL
jgi:hypothetical protein